MFFFFKQKTAYEMRISDWSSDVCSSDLQMLAIRPVADDEIVQIGVAQQQLGQGFQRAVDALARDQAADTEQHPLAGVPVFRDEPGAEVDDAKAIEIDDVVDHLDRKITRLTSSH